MGWQIRQSPILMTRPHRVSMGLAWGPFTHPCMEITCTSQPKALPPNQISYIWKGDPEYKRIQVSSLPLYKPQTLPFLRYVNPPYLLHSWVLGKSSITNLTFGGSLVGTHWCPLIGSSLLFFKYIHWHVCGRSTHWWFLCIINWCRL